VGKYDLYTTFDDPIPYEKDGKKLLFYPVSVRKYYNFMVSSEVLQLEKNTDTNLTLEEKLKRISENYLDFVFSTANAQNQNIMKLKVLLSLCLKMDEKNTDINFGYDKNSKAVFKVWETMYDGTDFDKIRDIITEQNLVEVPDESIQKELRDKLEEAERFKAKMNGVKMGTLEELLICVMISAPFAKIEDVYNLSIRKFKKILDRVDAKLTYEIYTSAAMSGMVEFKDKSVLRHWMANLDKKKYSDVMVSTEEMISKGLTPK